MDWKKKKYVDQDGANEQKKRIEAKAFWLSIQSFPFTLALPSSPSPKAVTNLKLCYWSAAIGLK